MSSFLVFVPSSLCRCVLFTSDLLARLPTFRRLPFFLFNSDLPPPCATPGHPPLSVASKVPSSPSSSSSLFCVHYLCVLVCLFPSPPPHTAPIPYFTCNACIFTGPPFLCFRVRLLFVFSHVWCCFVHRPTQKTQPPPLCLTLYFYFALCVSLVLPSFAPLFVFSPFPSPTPFTSASHTAGIHVDIAALQTHAWSQLLPFFSTIYSSAQTRRYPRTRTHKRLAEKTAASASATFSLSPPAAGVPTLRIFPRLRPPPRLHLFLIRVAGPR